ncbi:MAG TPA: AAA family ATPase [Planctomycetota bacterium]|nr:AAA family ATPase [Planctomycetota bacterium]
MEVVRAEEHVKTNGNGNGNGHGHLGSISGIRRAQDGLDLAPFTPVGGSVEETPLRIYIAGAHSTGKTTLARWIARTYKLPLVTEVARAVLAELEIPLETLRVDLDRTRTFQKEVFRRQYEMESLAGNRFVSDRTFDNLAYACHHTLALNEIARDLVNYSVRLREPGSIVFFVRPHRDLLTEDGIRASVSWEEILRIDGMVKLLLELHDVDYITIDTLNMAERARTVRGVLSVMRVGAVA